MAEPNYSIALDTKPPDAMKSLGSIMDLAGKTQTLQTGKVQQEISRTELQKQQIGLGERQGIQELFSKPELFQDESGQFNYDKLINEGMKRAPTTFPAMIPQIIQARTAGVNYEQAVTNLDQTKRQNVGQWFQAQEGKPLDQVMAEAANLKKLDPGLGPTIDMAMGVVRLAAPRGQEALNAAFRNLGIHAMPPQTQAAVTAPSGVQVDTGAGGYAVNTNRFAGTVGGTIPGTPYTKGLPPTQPVLGGTKEEPQMGVVGGAATQPPAPMSGVGVGTQPQAPQQAPGRPQTARLEVTEPSRGGGGFRPTAPPVGAEKNIEGTVEAVNRDWNSTVASAQTASQDIGVLQNIKQYAKGAVMGVAGDRRAYIAGLAGLLKVDAAELEKTNTDLLAKNSNMLALAGGDTNLAKLMAESANPNTHMTPEAAEHAANQVIAQRRLALAKQSYMQNFKGSPQQYTKELTEFNKIADPRVLQVPDMSNAEIARMKASMSASEQKEFGEKIRKAQALGFIR